MRENQVRSLIRRGDVVVNAWMSSDSGFAAEVLSHAGFDSVTVDAQHGLFGRDSIVKLLQAISAGPAMPMVRPSRLDTSEIGWLLDAGAFGIICPSIDSAEDAARLVAACRYPPAGARSFGPGRGLLYGGADYVAHANEVMVWAMVESAAALEALDSIASTPGLDGIYVGPNDLALSLGATPGGPMSPRVADHVRLIQDRAHAHGIAAGVFCADGEEAARWASLGYDLVTPGNDMATLRTAASTRVRQARGGSGRIDPPQGY